jgi:hypothetical protein
LPKLSIRNALVGLLAVVVPVVLASSASGQNGLVITDLVSPRGLSTDGSYLYVAEIGTGNILRVSQEGSAGVIASGLPTTITDSPEGPLPSGPTSAINVGGTFFVTVGEAPGNAGFDSVYRVTPGQAPVLVADLLAYEQANNVDGDVDMDGEPELLVNAYDLVSDNAGGLYVSASGTNAILHVSPSGEITPFAIFLNRDNPLFPAVGGPTMDQVPTGLEWGPDGALYVSTLTGFPFPNGEALVYRMTDTDGDGDALEDGETTVYASGLTTATNIAFDSDGSLLVTEFSTNMLEQAPGRVVRVVNGEISEVVAAPIVSPTGITVFDGEIIVASEFPGIVGEASTVADIIASAGPPDQGGAITPPSTGDAGLADSASSSTALLLAAGLVAGAALATRTAVSVRR